MGWDARQWATTFWEYFDPAEKVMNVLRCTVIIWKSLCHAWGSSPIYLIGRYLIGLKPTQPGYKRSRYTLNWLLGNFKESSISAEGDYIALEVKDRMLTIDATKAGGTLIIGHKRISIPTEHRESIVIEGNK